MIKFRIIAWSWRREASRRQRAGELVYAKWRGLAAGAHHGATFYRHQAFARAVRGEGPVAVTTRDGLLAVAIGVAAEISARERRALLMAELDI